MVLPCRTGRVGCGRRWRRSCHWPGQKWTAYLCGHWATIHAARKSLEHRREQLSRSRICNSHSQSVCHLLAVFQDETLTAAICRRHIASGDRDPSTRGQPMCRYIGRTFDQRFKDICFGCVDLLFSWMHDRTIVPFHVVKLPLC